MNFKLLNEIDSLVNYCLLVNSLETRITASVKELGELLQKVGGGGVPGQPQPPAHHEADEVLRPLMDILVRRQRTTETQVREAMRVVLDSIQIRKFEQQRLKLLQRIKFL